MPNSNGRRDSAPLCPAGHLPHLGGDQQFRGLRPSFSAGDWRKPRRHPISLLVGEMAGRPEGGAKDRQPTSPNFGDSLAQDGPLNRGCGASRSSAEIVRASEGSMIGMPSRTG